MRISDWSSDVCSSDLPLGLGHAIWCARAIVGDDPFAIFLPDELMIARKNGGTGCMKQMVDAYQQLGGNLLSVLEVPHEEVSSYGVIDPGATDGAITEVRGLVEKPPLDQAPSSSEERRVGKECVSKCQ